MTAGRRAVPLAALLAGACAAPPTAAPDPALAACPGDLTEQVSVTGFFGRNGVRGGRTTLRVSEADWRRFLAAELLPRIPGSTITDAVGTWRGQDRPEPSKVVTVLAAPAAAGETLRAFQDAAAAYRRAFDQRSVGILVTRACAAGF